MGGGVAGAAEGEVRMKVPVKEMVLVKHQQIVSYLVGEGNEKKTMMEGVVVKI